VTALTFALWPLGPDGCETCSREVFPVAPATPGSEILSVLGNGLGASFVAAAVLVVAQRHRALPSGHRGQDEAAAAVIGAGVVITAVIVLDVLARTVVPSLEQATVPALFAMSLIAPVAFVVALVRERLTLPARVARFLRHLDRSTTSMGLERALADALGDGEARLGFWIPERSGYVDIGGRPIERAELGAATPIVRDGEPLGILVQGERSTSDPELVRTLAAAASIEVERSRLEAQLRARVDELRASRARVIEAADEAGGGSSATCTTAPSSASSRPRSACGSCARRSSARLRPPSPARRGARELQGALGDLRELARGLHPSVLTELGLGEALKAAAMRSPIPAQVLAAPDERLPPLLESTAYFVACEALANAAKHSGASRITVRAACEGAVLVVEVADDGAGGATSTGGSGLRGLEDRAGALDGRVTVVSPPGAGTLVRAELPLDGGGQDGGKPDGRVAAGMAPSGAWR
jgi:signal transduction histidine kinase